MMMPNNQTAQPQSAAQLKRWLLNKGVDLSSWGSGQAKSVHNLWREIAEGESQLFDKPVCRVVESVAVLIQRGEQILVETRQQLPDGRIRQRHWPPSEKLQSGENYLKAAVRGLWEELHLPAEQIHFDLHTHHQRERLQESVSYPSLLALYRLHLIHAQIPTLPANPFTTTESTAKGTQQTQKIHHWAWRTPPEEFLSLLK